MADPVRYPGMTTAQLRETFMVDSLYKPGELNLSYIDLDRAVVGMAVPVGKSIALHASDMLRAQYFTERRELGVLGMSAAMVLCA